jgi:apolipoprotein N-acyltransferase
MEQISINRRLPGSKWLAILLLLLAAASKILTGPKMSIALFAWLTPIFLLYFFRMVELRRKILWAFPFLLLGNFISSYNVVPFPIPVLVILTILSTLKEILIFWLDRKLFQKSNLFITTLFFPAACVAMEFINTKTGGGAWWSVANSQYSFKWLLQLASITGMWGISFLIYWFASVTVWALRRFSHGQNFTKGVMIYGAIFLVVIFFGAERSGSQNDQRKIRIAGLSAPVFRYLEAMYKTATGKEIKINPRLSISSPELQQVSRAQVPFIETADTVKYKAAYDALQQINDSLFTLSQQAAEKGAKIITWSEANAIAFNFNDTILTERGRRFAAKNKVYLLMAMAIMQPGKITAGKKFIENKAVFIGPDGNILNVFHKNKPVPFAESSQPGDGIIPVIETAYGRVSTSICYDADFPIEMRQLSKNKTDVLLLPSGDWYSISPYHTYMAVLRGIENGCSIVRQVSGGLSVAVDYRGEQHASLDFYREGIKLWVSDVPVGHKTTVYAFVGDVFAYLCWLYVAGAIIYLLVGTILFRKKEKKNLPA